MPHVCYDDENDTRVSSAR